MSKSRVMSKFRLSGNLPFLIALLAAEIVSSLELTMIYTAMPAMARAFQDTSSVGWIVTSNLLVSAVSAALCGRLGDLYGRREVLLIVLVITAIGSLISATSGVLIGVIIGSSMQGVAGALLPLCLALVRERMAPEQVPPGVGIVIAAATVSAAVGLLFGGFMVDHFGWASIFWVSCFFAVFAIGMVLMFIAKSSQPAAARAGVDMVRGVLFAPGIAGLLLALTQSRVWGWGDPKILGILAASTILLLYWGRHQLRQANPLIDLRLLADRRVALAYLCISLVGAGMMQVILVMSMFIQQPTATMIGLGLGATTAGAMLMPIRVIGLVASPWSGWLTARRGARLTLLIGAFLGLAGWIVIALGRHETWAVLMGMVLEGAGFTVAYVAVPSILLKTVPVERSGEALGLSSVFRSAFSAVGSQIVMLLLATSSTTLPEQPGVLFPAETAYLMVFGYIMVTCALCAVAAYMLPRNDSWIENSTKVAA